MIVLPFPPSVNTYWRMVRGRMLISKAGREYRAAITGSLAIQRMRRWNAVPLEVSITAWLPDARRRDVDNMFKAPLDALAHVGMYDDDSQIQSLSIVKAGIDRVNPRLEVRIREMERA